MLFLDLVKLSKEPPGKLVDKTWGLPLIRYMNEHFSIYGSLGLNDTDVELDAFIESIPDIERLLFLLTVVDGHVRSTEEVFDGVPVDQPVHWGIGRWILVTIAPLAIGSLVGYITASAGGGLDNALTNLAKLLMLL